jgi:hypothetical protein
MFIFFIYIHHIFSYYKLINYHCVDIIAHLVPRQQPYCGEQVVKFILEFRIKSERKIHFTKQKKGMFTITYVKVNFKKILFAKRQQKWHVVKAWKGVSCVFLMQNNLTIIQCYISYNIITWIIITLQGNHVMEL